MSNGDLNTAKINKVIFDKLIKNTEKEFRFSFKPDTVNKICDRFVADSERLIQPIELSYEKHKQEIKEAQRLIKEVAPIEDILKDVTKRRDDFISKLRKWPSKNNMVFCRLFEYELQKLIDHKDYSVEGIDFLWGIYDKRHEKMKKELADDKTNFLKTLCTNLIKTYGVKFRSENGNTLFEEKVQRLRNYLNDLSK